MGLALKKPDGVAGSAAPAILVGLFVAFGGVLFGFVLSSVV
jgi:SP family sugar:H+ symporter-like MFS transporter